MASLVMLRLLANLIISQIRSLHTDCPALLIASDKISFLYPDLGCFGNDIGIPTYVMSQCRTGILLVCSVL